MNHISFSPTNSRKENAIYENDIITTLQQSLISLNLGNVELVEREKIALCNIIPYDTLTILDDDIFVIYC